MVPDLWVEVDIAALKHNFAQVKSLLAPDVRVAAVVKSNGFGHGYVEPSRAFVEAGADMLAVTRIDEAVTIRNAEVSAPILIFAPIQAANAAEAITADFDITVSSLGLLQAVSDAARRAKKTARIHIKIDTGMGRLGVLCSEAHSLIQTASSLSNIKIAGIYTHFASASARSLASSKEQLNEFQSLITDLNARGLHYEYAHAANSAAILRLPEAHLDMVRPGTVLYGQYPSTSVPRTLDLRPTWKLKARVCEIKTLPKGCTVGYGAEFKTSRVTRTAVVAVGYADGYTMVAEGPVYRQGLVKLAARKFRRHLQMEIRGQSAPVIGRVAMQMTVLDVTDVPNVQPGDEVTVPAMRIPTNPLIPRLYSQ